MVEGFCQVRVHRLRHQGRHHRHPFGPVLVVVLAHQRMREEGARHGRVRVVGAEQRRVVLDVFGVGGLGEEGAAHRFDPQYRRFASQAPVDRIGIARELLDRDGLVQGRQARGQHG